MEKIYPVKSAPSANSTHRLPKAIFVGLFRTVDNTMPIQLTIDSFTETHLELLKREIAKHLKEGKNVEVKVGKSGWYLSKVARTARTIASWEDYFYNTIKRIITVEINKDMPDDLERTYVIFNAGKV